MDPAVPIATVASDTIPLEFGTQTMALLNRPVTYCGIAAFKPSTPSVSGFGVSPLVSTFDPVGFYGWSVDDAVYAYEFTCGAGYRLWGSLDRSGRQELSSFKMNALPTCRQI